MIEYRVCHPPPPLSCAPSNRKEFSHSFDSKPAVEISSFWHYPRSSSIIDKDVKCIAAIALFRNWSAPVNENTTVMVPFVIMLGKHLEYYNRLHEWSLQASPEFRNLLFLFPLLPSPIFHAYTIFRKGTRWLKEPRWLSFPIMIIVRSSVIIACRNILSRYCNWKENSTWKKILSKLSFSRKI